LEDQIICDNANTNNIQFIGNVNGTIYQWTNTNTTIGLSVNGVGDIGSFKGINSTNNTISGTILVTPMFTNAGITCTGTARSMVISVIPKPTVNPISDQEHCTGGVTNPVLFSGNVNGTIYTWTNSETSIGLAALGINNIPSFTTINTGTVPVISTIEVIPSYTSLGLTCIGSSKKFNYTIQPLPFIGDMSRSICSATELSVSPVNGGVNSDIVPPNTRYIWSVSSNSNVTGQYNATTPQSNFSQTLTNLTNSVQQLIYTITPISGNTIICTGQSFTLTVTIQPKASIPDQQVSICSEKGFVLTPTSFSGTTIIPEGTTYNWLMPSMSSGITGGIIGTNQNSVFGTFVNSTNIEQAAAYLVRPISGACEGASFKVNVEIKPLPRLSSVKQASAICTKSPFNYSASSTVANTSFTWIRQTVLGINNLPSSGNTNNISEILYNITDEIIRVPYIYTLTARGCSVIDTIYVDVLPNTPAVFAANNNKINCQPFFYQTFSTPAEYASVKWYYTDSTGRVLANINGYNSSYEFTNPGTYKVSMIGYHPNGCPDTLQKSVLITPSVRVSFTPNDSIYCGPIQKLRFINTSTYNGAGSVIYKWFVNDTLLSNDSNEFIYTFKTNSADTGAVKYMVRLEATTTVNNCVQVFSQPIILLPPRALFTASSIITCAPKSIVFTNNSKYVKSYEWYINDSLFSIASQPASLILKQPNKIYSVKLVADAGNGCSKDSLIQIIKTLPNPNSSINLSSNESCGNSELVVSASMDSSIATHKWIWTTNSLSAPSPTIYINNNIARFYFPINNTQSSIQYRIAIIDSSVVGCVDSSIAVYNLHPKPNAFFDIEKIEACSPWLLKPLNNSSLGNNDLDITGVVGWKVWRRGLLQSFGTGNLAFSSSIWNPSFLLTNTGTIDSLYDIQLIVNNRFACSDTIIKSVIVHPSPIADLLVGILQDDAPFRINKQNNLRAVHYPGINASYLWRIINPVTKAVLSTSVGLTPANYTISQMGDSILVEMIALSSFGCTADTARVLMKTNRLFTADFDRSDSIDCKLGSPITFKDISISKGTTIIEQFWDFGDGTTGSGSQVIHSYTKPGIYWVSLYVKDANGIISDKKVKRVVVFGPAIPNFLNTNACKDLVTSFTNNSILGFGSTKFELIKWDFGDGNISNLENPTHIYQNPGKYSVTLTVRGDSSCVSNAITKLITVYGPPNSNFTYTNNCINVPTFFKNTTNPSLADDGYDIVDWDFGDGERSSEKEPQHVYKISGTYKIQLITASKSCPSNRDTIVKQIKINLPREPIEYPLLKTVKNRQIILNAQSGGVSYLWTPATGLSNRLVKNPTAFYKEQDPAKINYVITISDSSGCSVDDRQEVWIFNKSDVYVPTAFSPNADGVNDLLLPFYINIKSLIYLRIYDRWGKLIFQTTDLKKGWDGLVNGKQAPLQTYAWVIDCVDADGKKIFKKGMVTLIRD
jgi:gliding motility-associated-like protein